MCRKIYYVIFFVILQNVASQPVTSTEDVKQISTRTEETDLDQVKKEYKKIDKQNADSKFTNDAIAREDEEAAETDSSSYDDSDGYTTPKDFRSRFSPVNPLNPKSNELEKSSFTPLKFVLPLINAGMTLRSRLNNGMQAVKDIFKSTNDGTSGSSGLFA